VSLVTSAAFPTDVTAQKKSNSVTMVIDDVLGMIDS